MRFPIAILIFLFSISISAQSTIFKMDKSYKSIREGGLNPLLKLDSEMIHGRSLSAKIKKLPVNINKSNAAYGFIYYHGIKNSFFRKSIAYLVDNYSSSTPTIYIDKNGNLDFTDDGAPLKFGTTLDFNITRSDDAFAHSYYRMTKSSVAEKNIANVKSYYGSKFPKGNLVSPKYWPVSHRLNVRKSSGLINEKPVTILLFDMNFDSYFLTQENNTQYDKVLISEGVVEKDLFSSFQEALPIHKSSIFSLYSNRYFLNEVDKNGDFVSISETDKKGYDFYKEGSDVASYSIELLNKKKVKLEDFLKTKKYLLIDVGGTWCGGCVAQESTIKKLSKSIEVLGVFANDTKKSVDKYVERRKIHWPVALMKEEFKNKFKISSFPTYILVSPKGKIVFTSPNSEDIVKYISQHS